MIKTVTGQILLDLSVLGLNGVGISGIKTHTLFAWTRSSNMLVSNKHNLEETQI